MTSRPVAGCMGVAAMLVFVGAALAQPPEPPLSGPPVRDARPAGLGGQFSEGQPDRKGPLTERVPMRLYADAINKLRGEEAPAELRLTPEQDQKVKGIEEDFRAAMREFRQRMNQEGIDVRPPRPPAEGGPGGQNPQPPQPGQGAGSGAGQPRPDRARMAEMRRFAPWPEDYQVKIYALLSAPQQKFVEGEVARSRAQLQKQRDEEYMQRELEKRKGGGAGAPPGLPNGQPAPVGFGEGRERVRRIVERLQQLPPEEREQLIMRLEQELDKRLGDGNGPRRPLRGGAQKPPPPMDDVKVPPPPPKPD